MPPEPALPLVEVVGQQTNSATLVRTSDGSFTLLHTGFNQTYHSVNGALQEARHVFLEQGMLYFLNKAGMNKAGADKTGTGKAGANTTVRVLEVGFGAGLNFLVSAAHCLENGPGTEPENGPGTEPENEPETGPSLIYTGIEPFPVRREILLKSNYAQLLPAGKHREAYLSWYPGPEPLYLSPNVQLELLRAPLLETGSLSAADVVYFDAFAPATQPEMWTPEAISHVTSALEPGGIFVSYSITGSLKRILKGLGFTVEKPKGAAGKREMIRAVKH